MKHQTAEQRETVWKKFECDHGARWTCVQGGICDDTHEGDACNFSGCQAGHFVHLRGTTTDGNNAHNWFRHPDIKAKSTHYQPKTGVKCSCKPGIMRDNCSFCEGTGWQIDFKAIRARSA